MEDHEITLINNEIKDVTKLIKPLQNRGILLKGSTKKVINQKIKIKNPQCFWTITKNWLIINEKYAIS